MPVKQRLWVNMSPVQQTFITLIPARTVNIEQSSLDGIDRSNKHPSLLVNAGVDGPFMGLKQSHSQFTLTTYYKYE